VNLVAAIAFGLIMGAGTHLLVRRDLVRLAAGTVLLTNAAVLLLVSAGFGARQTPLLPMADPARAADPVVQALAITAVVIAFGVTVLLLRVAAALHETHKTLDLEEIQQAEEAEEERMEAGEDLQDGREAPPGEDSR
jgi:multicomponent Na+:H+ antiporter subunit C